MVMESFAARRAMDAARIQGNWATDPVQLMYEPVVGDGTVDGTVVVQQLQQLHDAPGRRIILYNDHKHEPGKLVHYFDGMEHLS